MDASTSSKSHSSSPHLLPKSSEIPIKLHHSPSSLTCLLCLPQDNLIIAGDSHGHLLLFDSRSLTLAGLVNSGISREISSVQALTGRWEAFFSLGDMIFSGDIRKMDVQAEELYKKGGVNENKNNKENYKEIELNNKVNNKEDEICEDNKNIYKENNDNIINVENKINEICDNVNNINIKDQNEQDEKNNGNSICSKIVSNNNNNIYKKQKKKIIIGKDEIKTEILSEYEDEEITDFLLTPENNIIYPDQEEESFYIYDRVNNKNESFFEQIDKFYMSSAYGQEYVGSTKNICLYSFDGEIVIYNVKKKENLINCQIKDYLKDDNIDKNANNISNPPYLNKVVYNSYTDELICGMMNGAIIGIDSQKLDKKRAKIVHNGSINDVKISKFNMNNKNQIITFGVDKCLKFIDPYNYNIDYYADMSCNVIDFDSDDKGNIFYIDDNNKILYEMKLNS